MSVTTITTTRERSSTLPPSFRKRYASPEQVEELYGIPVRQLRYWREIHVGPRFKVFRNRIVLYEVGALEEWIDSLPDGVVANESQEG